jgi:hypothetical protein
LCSSRRESGTAAALFHTLARMQRAIGKSAAAKIGTDIVGGEIGHFANPSRVDHTPDCAPIVCAWEYRSCQC